jgi:hypothetical protein
MYRTERRGSGWESNESHHILLGWEGKGERKLPALRIANQCTLIVIMPKWFHHESLCPENLQANRKVDFLLGTVMTA